MTMDALPLYFHGLPGSASELMLFGAEAAVRASGFAIAPRNFPTRPVSADRFALIADAIRREHGDRPLRLIGFSLGAAAALRVAPLLGPQVERIDLVSAAAPLDLGSYLDGMAGAPVFRLARDHPTAFHLLVKSQALLARAFPAMLYSALFRTAQGRDQALSQDPGFRSGIIRILRECLVDNLDSYRSELQLYVRDWSQSLEKVDQPVHLFHGRSDNWSPVAMATDLANHLKSCAALNIVDDGSHYSTLKAFLLKN